MNNPETTVQVYKLQPDEIDVAAIQELPTITTETATFTEQAVSLPHVEEKDLTINFFIIGGAINIIMILSYFVWAFMQWKKIDKRKKAKAEIN